MRVAAAWNDVPATGGLSECAALVRSAEALRTSAPELGVQLARRALLVGASDISATTAHTGEARALSMRAQAVLASGSVRISRHVDAVEPGFAALALAESGGALVLAAELRLDLAACAQELGEPLLGGALLRPVLEATQAPPSVRAAALGRLVGCVAHVARRDDVEDALHEADRLLAADDGLSADARRMERAWLAVRTAAYHRWYGDNEDAVTAARDGLNLLSRLHRELRAETDRLHARLVLELVCALLDEGELHEAETMARPTVEDPVRATSAESVGQLMLALATRIHLPAGEVDRGRGLVDQAVWLAERHGLDSVLADALTEASRLDEQIGRTREALEAMRAARAAEQRRMRAVSRAARHLLVQVGAGQGVRDVTQQSVAALLRQLAHPAGVPVSVAPPPSRSTLPPPRTPAEPQAEPELTDLTGAVDERTGLLNREGLFRRLRAVRTGERPVALTLVRFEPNKDNPEAEDRGPDTGIMVGLASKVRDIAPENAELARSDGGELAVFLPHTTRDQAEEFAATIREKATKSDWLSNTNGKDLSISTSVVQSDPQTTDPDSQMDAAGMLTAARDALTPAQPPTGLASTHQPAGSTPTGIDSLTETKAALSTLSEQPAPDRTPSYASALPERPRTALEDEPPTTPLHRAKPGDPSRAGRSVLNALSIPTGSGGRRRAGGEPAPGEKPTRPTEPSQAPRLTQADHSAPDPQDLEPKGWPAEPDISQALRRTTAQTRRSTDDTPPTDAAHPTDVAEAAHLAGAAYSADATRLAGLPPAPEALAAELPPPSVAAYASEPKAPSTYEETRAELARMMSTLNAKALRSRTRSEDPPSAGQDAAGVDPREVLVPRQSIPTTPEPEEMPEPPSRPDIPEPPRRPDIPEPPAPDPFPPLTPEPAEPGTPGEPRSRLMAAFDALTGPVLSPFDDDPAPRDSEPDGDTGGDPGVSDSGVADSDGDDQDEKLAFRTDFGNGSGLPSRKPLKSWAQIESASVVDSPADNLFGAPAEKKPFWASLGTAFGAGEPEETERPAAPPNREENSWDSAELVVNPTDGGRFSTSAELRAALWERGFSEPVAAVPYELPSVVPGEWIIGPVRTSLDDEVSATFDERSADLGNDQEPPSGAAETPSGASAELHAPTTAASGENAAATPLTSDDEKAAPSLDPHPFDVPIYDEPIGPQPRPEGLPRRGERSATTIASLLTEALAAYQSTTDDEDEPHRGPERFDWDPTAAGRHRSPE